MYPIASTDEVKFLSLAGFSFLTRVTTMCLQLKAFSSSCKCFFLCFYWFIFHFDHNFLFTHLPKRCIMLVWPVSCHSTTTLMHFINKLQVKKHFLKMYCLGSTNFSLSKGPGNVHFRFYGSSRLNTDWTKD